MVSGKRIGNSAVLRSETPTDPMRRVSGSSAGQKCSYSAGPRIRFYRHLHKSVIDLVLILMIFIGRETVVQAKELTDFSRLRGDANCVPVDLVFIVDQSSDMAKDDPRDMRIETIKWLFNYLGFDRLLTCPDVVHRVALIGFNDHDMVQLDLTPIDPNPSSSDPWQDWESKYSRLIEPVQGINIQARRSEGLVQALQHSADILRDAPATGAGERKKAVILIMGGDGTPCSENYLEIGCTIYGMDKHHAKRDIDEQLRASMSDDLSFWVLTYSAHREVDKYEFDGFWKEKTEQYRGKFYPRLDLKGEVSIARALQDVLLSLSPRSGVIEVCGNWYFDPFLEKLGFNVLSAAPMESSAINFNHDTASSIVSPSVSSEGMQVLYSPQAAPPSRTLYYLYGRPTPGKWSITGTNCNNNKALVIAQIVTAKRILLVEPNEILPQYEKSDRLFDPQRPYHLKFQVVDAEGGAILQYPSFKADISAKVIGPTGAEQTLEFDYANAFYTSKEALYVNKKDKYTINIEFHVPSANPDLAGQYRTILYEGMYEVAPRVPMRMEILYPAPAGRVPVHGSFFDLKHWMRLKPVEVNVHVKFDLLDDSAVPELGNAITGDKTKTIKALLYDSSNRRQEEIWLQPSPTDPLVFTGAFSNETFTLPGTYSLKIFFDDTQYNAKQFLYLADANAERVEFRRKDGLFDAPLFYYIVFLLIGLATVVALGMGLFAVTDPAQGYLLFYPPEPKSRPFAILKLAKARARRVYFDQDELRQKSFILSNLESIEVRTPHLGGKSQLISIVETAKGKLPDREVAKDAEKPVEIGSTSANYTIHYSKVHPDVNTTQ